MPPSTLLGSFHTTVRTAEIPETWLTSMVVTIHKEGKPMNQPDFYRPLSLTSCVGKLLERLVLRELTWYLDTLRALPTQLCGFRSSICTANAMGDIAPTLEQARSSHQTVYCVFLEIHKVFDALPHPKILRQLQHFGISGSLYNYISAFVKKKWFCVRVPGATTTRSSVTQGRSPQNSDVSH